MPPFPVVAVALLWFTLLLAALALGVVLARRHLRPEHVAALFRLGLLATLYAAVATVVVGIFLSTWSLHGDHPGRGLEALMEHRGERPFVFRVLTPELIGRVSGLVERRVARDDPEPWLRSPLRRFAKPGERWDVRKSVAFHVAYGMLLASLVVAQTAARSLARTVYRGAPALADFAPPLATLLLPLTFVRGGYVYDFPELALLFLCVACLAARRLGAYYVFFLLACLNKESSALIVLYFVAFAAWRLPVRRWIPHAAAQAALGAAIIVALRVAFEDQPRSAAWFLLPLNLYYLIQIPTYLGFHSPYGPLVPFPAPFNLLSLFAVGFAVAWRWRAKPLEVRTATVLVGAGLLPPFLAYGFFDEVRALAIGFPALYLAALHTVRDLYAREPDV